MSQFGSQGPEMRADAKRCAQFEALLADAVDGALSAEQQAMLDEHAASCVSCSVQLEEAQRGAAWMEMLKSYPPEPTSDLAGRILAQTSAVTAAEAAMAAAERRAHVEAASLMGVPARSGVAGSGPGLRAGAGWTNRLAVPLRPVTHTVLQPRFMLTAAMAFFSVALTMNVAGIHLDQIRASDLKPSSLRRSFYQANAHVVRYYDNLRVVYELESRVHDLQHASGDSNGGGTYPSAPADAAPQKREDAPPQGGKPADKGPDGAKTQHAEPHSGSSRREVPNASVVLAAYVVPEGAAERDRLRGAVKVVGRRAGVWPSWRVL